MIFSPRSTSFAATAIAVVASVLAYPFLPKRVATQFTAQNRPERSSARAIAVLRLPAVMAGVAILNDLLGAWPGARDREDAASGLRARDAAIGLCELAVLSNHLAVVANGLGVPLDMNRILRGIYGVLIIALGNVMPKLPRSGVVGIRTPWTLSDPAVWERTHRLGGYLFMAAGLVSLASLPATGERAQRVPKLALLGAVGVSVVYSGVAYARRTR